MVIDDPGINWIFKRGLNKYQKLWVEMFGKL